MIHTVWPVVAREMEVTPTSRDIEEEGVAV
jgi:hypothetical protein